MDKKEIDKLIEHPLEDMFGIEPGTTMTTEVIVETPISRPANYEDKDAEIDNQFQEIYNLSLTAFNDQIDDLDSLEPKFRSRASEVAASYLTTALQAANAKAALKSTRDKHDLSKIRLGDIPDKAGLVTTDRNKLLRLLDEEDGNDPLDGEFTEE